MRRIVYSVILGFIIPLAYLIGCGILAYASIGYVSPAYSSPWFVMYIYGKPVSGLIFAPVGVPEYLYALARAKGLLPTQFFSGYAQAGFFIFFNWSLYGIISYFLLGRLKRFRKQSVSGIDTPPAPPSFESE